MDKQVYKRIYQHYESTLEKFGPNHQGMDWPKEKDLTSRFMVMLDVVNFDVHQNKSISLLDLGCGVGLFLDFLSSKSMLNKINYFGVDISGKMIAQAKKRNKNESFEERDILEAPFPKESFDYVIMNGVLTEKVSLTHKQMVVFAKEIIHSVFSCCRYGVAFNVMSSHVDWERQDLFHWRLDELVSFLVKECSRNIRIVMDYGLYEYTVYLYKTPQY